MNIGENGIDRFLQTWAAEFARGLAGLLSEYPTVNCTRARHLGAVDLEGILWWRATLQVEQPFSIWIGAREATWSITGKLNWMRNLERVQAAAAILINRELIQPIRTLDSQLVYSAPDAQALSYALMGIRLNRTELPALLVALGPAASHQLRLKNPDSVSGPMLERLLDLELPLSVALGRAKLPLGEVLKITSGSVIHLNGYTGSEVEVLVHGTVVARGQVVSNKGAYGVRVTQIISQVERAKLYQSK